MPIHTRMRPTTARPVRPKPITAPDWNATPNDLASDTRAADAVRTLPIVAMRMPMYPAATDVAAPTMKARAVCQPWLTVAAISTANKAMKIASTRYSRFKNAMAPSAMAVEISVRRETSSGDAAPSSMRTATTRLRNTKATTSDSTPRPKMDMMIIRPFSLWCHIVGHVIPTIGKSLNQAAKIHVRRSHPKIHTTPCTSAIKALDLWPLRTLSSVG